MTLSSDVIKFIRSMYGNKCIYPKIANNITSNANANDITVNTFNIWPENLSLYKNIVIDSMVNIRSMSNTVNIDGFERTMTCLEFVSNIAESSVKIIRENKEQIKILIFRLDRLNATAICKGAIYGERYKNIKEYELDEFATESPFNDQNDMPDDIHSIFKNFKARKLFYVYLTNHLIKSFSCIDCDQKVIIDGGILDYNDKYDGPIIIFKNNESLNGEYKPIKVKKLCEGEFYLKEGEADLGCPFWAHKLSSKSIIQSEDGDMILISMLQVSRQIYLAQTHKYFKDKKSALEDLSLDYTKYNFDSIIRKKMTYGYISYEGEELERSKRKMSAGQKHYVGVTARRRLRLLTSCDRIKLGQSLFRVPDTESCGLTLGKPIRFTGLQWKE